MKKIIKTIVIAMMIAMVAMAFVGCFTEEDPCANGHTLEAYAEEPATCTEDGLSAGVICSVCGHVERTRFTIPAKGHKMADATCTEPSTCTREGCGHTEGEALGHSWTECEALAPTCQAAGHTAYKLCSTCGEIEGQETLELDPDAHTANAAGKCACGVYVLPEAGVAFKLVVVQVNLGKTLYFTGAMNNYYYATSENIEDAVDLYIETAEEGFHIYFLDGETKNYLYVEQSGSYTNIKFGETQGVWTFNSELGTLVTNVGGTDYYIGTYKTFNTISASKTSYINAENVNISQFAARPIVNPVHECDYTEATCTAKATCKICGLTTGEMLEHAYDMENGVVTDPTCTDAGYTTYTCACGATQTVAGDAALDHAYVDGACSRCFAAEPVDYYLIGWINGADYGNASDWENLGDYKFVDGKLTVTFTADSYVGVKSANTTGGIVGWFWAENYITATEGTFAHGKDWGEKMYVPGNVEITFTLVVNEDGSLALSYEVASSEPVVETLATFEFGENASAAHKDGNDLGTSATYTDGSYSLSLTDMSKVYGPAYDAQGNSCIKLGTSSSVGTFTFTVPENVTEVVIYVAKYKSNTTNVSINGGTTQALTKNSNDGEYDVITIDTTTTKTVTLATVSGGVRCMVNTIVFNGIAQ